MNELANNVRSELLALQTMNEKELRKKWESLYGREAPNCGAPFLRRRLACPGNCIWRRGQGDAQKDQEPQCCKDQETETQSQSPRRDEYQPHLASSEIRGDNSAKWF